MAHSIIKVVHEVLDQPDNYPEVIVTQAQSLMDWSDIRRAKIKYLWDRRAMLKQFRSRYRSFPRGTTAQRRSMAATTDLRANFTTKEINDFHEAKNAINSTYKDLVQSGGILQRFQASLEVLHSTELTTMLRYLECVNAQRKDGTVDSVGFLRWTGASFVAEILAWRLVRAHGAS